MLGKSRATALNSMNLFERIALSLSNRTPLLRDIYLSLPLIREFKMFQADLADIRADLSYVAKMNCLEAIKANHLHYRDPKRLLSYGAQYWSQNFEDGMIEEIFKRVFTTNCQFVEIGVGDGSQNNTTALLAAGWKGWWIEGNSALCSQIEKSLSTMPTLQQRVKVRQALVSPVNIRDIFAELAIPSEPDLFSLDIDLDTYHIWSAIPDFRPRVIVVEYNSAISPHVEWVSPWKPNQFWGGNQAYGASLKSYELLGRSRGYSLVGCDLTGLNAFFVRNDLLGNHFQEPFTAENHFEPARYYLTFRGAHRSVLYGENHDPDRYPYV